MIPFESEPKKKKYGKTKEKETQLLGRTSQFDFASFSKNVSNNPNTKYKTKSNSYNKVEYIKKKKEQADLTQSGGGKEDEWQWGGG